MEIRKLLYGLGLFMVMGCKATPGPETEYTPPESTHATLAGSAWYFGDAENGSEPYLEFGEDNKISGSGGCNNFSAQFEQPEGIVDGRHMVSFGPIMSTKRACIGDGMKIEDEFFDKLSKARSFNIIHGNALLLYGEDGSKVLRLRKSEL